MKWSAEVDNPQSAVRIELYPFRYRDRLTGRWVRARYKATREEIAARYGEWEITGPAEIRSPETAGTYFRPFPPTTADELARALNPQPDMAPAVDAIEAFLAYAFLRRYVTWCARSRRYASAGGAAMLLRELPTPSARTLYQRPNRNPDG
jgi:hypothetical protein